MIASAFPQLTVEELPYHSSKFEALRNQLKPSRVRALAGRFRELAPSLVVAVQGNIEHSSLALHAALAAGIRSTSYIPVPHSNAEMGARLGALRDLFSLRLFKLPGSFITITDEMARLLELRGAVAPIRIVYNGIDTSRFRPGSAGAAVEQLSLPREKIRIGVIGRIEFRQKQQHHLVKAIASDPRLRESCHLVFAGEGPDRPALAALMEECGVAGTIIPWTDPAPLYHALDALVIPSRYEGLPLVMLEALASGTPVLASDRDGMRDFLPPQWRFPRGDVPALAASIKRLISEGTPELGPELFEKVRETMSLASFRRAFSAAVLDLAESP